MGSKPVCEELNERACVVGSLSPRGKGVFATTDHEDVPNPPIYIDPAANSSSSPSDVFATR